MADFTIKRNDTAPPLGPGTLRDAAGNAVNITGATSVKLTVTPVGGTTPKFSAEVQVLDAATGRWQYKWAATDTDTAGSYTFQIQVTYAAVSPETVGRKQTFPTKGSMTLDIDADLDAA